ncbi:MAG: hypothetical protein QM831_01305 [Kofleriaceae bacterium]
MLRCVLAFLVVAACSSNHHDVPADAPPPDAPVDTPTSYAACREFSDLGTSMPVHHAGMLDGADVESPNTCATTNAPYGINSAGPDAVTYISGLTPEMPYVVHVNSASDLAFYVVTGCDTPTGPSAAECVLFQDASTGSDEVGTFIAPASSVYVVVDYYASHAPNDLSYTLDVYPLACTTNAQCGGSTPVCDDGECVECSTSFDCTNPDAPRCDHDAHLCEAGVDQCTADDPDEPDDDGPAGARVITLDGDGTAQHSASICSQPPSERDYYAFDVQSLGETWDISLNWTGGHDLDLEVVSATGEQYGLSYWEQPEHVRLTYLPLGRYYVRISEFSSSPDPSPVAYTMTLHRTLGAGCTQASDCASEFRNQIYRGECDAGACVDIAGTGTVAQGGACDSQSDCSSGLSCPSFYFVADAATREVCAPSCATDADCAVLGTDYTCTTYLQHNFCVQKCQNDLQCPTVVGSQPQTGPWYRLSCQVQTGRCLP